MYLHIGNKKSVKDDKIIGIFDLDTATVSNISKDFINRKQRAGLVEYDNADLPRSFVLYVEDGKSRVKLSRRSTVGLKLRADEGYDTNTEI